MRVEGGRSESGVESGVRVEGSGVRVERGGVRVEGGGVRGSEAKRGGVRVE